MINRLLYTEGLLPSAITLIGDSAGAHLMLSLLLHLRHPNPLVSPLELKDNFSGAVLISPWVAMSSTGESMQANSDKDIISAATLEYWAQNFLGGAKPDAWYSPSLAPTEWWADLAVDEMLVLYGEDEILRDEASRLCEKLQVMNAWISWYLVS